jgi:hypothetical protein
VDVGRPAGALAEYAERLLRLADSAQDATSFGPSDQSGSSNGQTSTTPCATAQGTRDTFSMAAEDWPRGTGPST